MTLPTPSRVRSSLPILFFAGFLALAGCATQSPGPVGPISTGNPRVDPVPGDRDVAYGGVEEETMDEVEETGPVGPYIPPHMQGRNVIRAGVLLPFSHPNQRVRQQAEGMLAGIELALFDFADENIVLMPTDTGGSLSQAVTAAETLRDQEVDVVLGPLFGANVQPVREALMPEPETSSLFSFAPEVDTNSDVTPVIAFSNDRSAASYGAWLASIAPEEEVSAIIEYAALRGYDQFAFFGPQSDLGLRVESAMQQAVMENGGFMLTSAFYPASTTNPNTEAEYFSTTIAAAVEAGARVAVLVPERGNRLRRIAPLLAYYGVDTREVKMLGLGGWNDPNVWREPSLRGAWFPTAPSLDITDFQERYARIYGAEPTSLAAISYDAGALVGVLSLDGALTADELINRDGFMGINGLFRFRDNGTAERSLAIMEIDPNAEDGTGVKEILPVSPSFDQTIG